MSEIASLPKPWMTFARSLRAAFSSIAAVESPIPPPLGSGGARSAGKGLRSGDVRVSKKGSGPGEERGSKEEWESTVSERRLKGVGASIRRAELSLGGGGA